MSIVTGLFTGCARPNYGKDRPSAIDKHALNGAATIEAEGIVGDEQADRRVHGGPERALLHYSADHYPWWREQLPQRSTRLQPPGFGENLSSAGMDEHSVHIGDVYRIGSCRLQVSQPRSPCWKLNVRFDIPDMALQVQAHARCGWFYRVLKTGVIELGDRIELLERQPGSVSVAAAMHAVYKAYDSECLAWMVDSPTLSPNWRGKAEKCLQGGGDTTAETRLSGR